ncbi:UBIQUITIN-CONJUGAT-2 domain-containing protein [Mycena venus]|uniref:UBIQUITIN-CONJUGAT-2 domain-containing protein n=1 Tax=Mycena venus TaxID=2733690 RepID=A0A8H6YTW1_9AGAR|nr:UBIQUITIN-CONJUGAT-2 domain-containing protein [Mycena venus]
MSFFRTTGHCLPPKVSSSVDGINHPNLFGAYICCDLLKEHVYRESGYSGGYTPALTLRGLFLQFLTFFSSSKVEQEYGGYIEIGEAVTVRFALESDLTGRRTDQAALATQWKKDHHPVVVLSREMTEVGPLLETTKSPHPHLNRLHRIEEKNYRWTSTFNSIRYWQCQHCPYGSDALPHLVGTSADAMEVDPPSPLFIPPAVCLLHNFNDDVLYELALRLPSESLISFSTAYPRLHDIVHAMHILLQRELRCFFLRTPLSESVLGIGVALDFRARTLSSDFDWLSQRAFVEFGIRESVEKRAFSFFLPLAFSQPHFARVYQHIWERLTELDREVQRAEDQMSRNPRHRSATPQRHEVICVVYRMMTNIVVSLMKSCDSAFSAPIGTSRAILHASEKAVVAYGHLFHLVISLCRTDPHILADATNRLRRFIDRKDARLKTQVPDLGELIVLMMVVVCRPPVGSGPPIKWANLAGPFLEEVLIRNVRWVLKDSPHLEVMERGPSDYRLAETFDRSRTSLRLVMFQISFLDLFFKAYGSDISRLDNNYGFPEKELPERMVEEVKEIYKINTWPAFFTRVRFTQGVAFGKEKFSDMLRDAVKTSAGRRYHNVAPSNRLNLLQGQRRRVEEESARRLSKSTQSNLML